MIAPMSKVTVLCLATAHEEALRALRELGALHVVCHPSTAAQPPSAETAARRVATRYARDVLSSRDRSDRRAERSAAADADAIVTRVGALCARQTVLSEHGRQLRVEREALAPFGDFAPAQLAALADRGVRVTLFRAPIKRGFPEGADLLRLSTQGEFHHGASFGVLPTFDGLEIVAVPRRSLSELGADIAAVSGESEQIDAELNALASAVPALNARAAELDEVYGFQRVGESLASHGTITSLEGYCPVARMPDLRTTAERQGWALWVREPDADDTVPVLLDLPRWLRPIAVLFKGLGILPGYREADVSAVFLLFFSLFFAMLVGDAGYGLLILAAVFWARRKKPHAAPQPFWLFGVFALATIVWGVMAGSYFAIDSRFLPRVMHGLPWLTNPATGSSHLMWLCFLIGGTHLTIAHLWNAVVLFPARKALAQIGWIGVVWLMFFVAAQLVVGRPIPAAMPWIGGIGIVLVVLFMTDRKDFKEEWINHPMLFLSLISCLVDIISYIRLFAVGMASAQIALNFNQMAMGLPLPLWVKPLGVAVILILGHGLNLALSALSILVHGVRLNTLEFSSHKGMTWSGQPYDPFRKHTPRSPA